MKKIIILVLFLNFIWVSAQDKVVTKNGKEVQVNVDATTTTKGIVKLAGDLSGTADLPTVPGLLTKQNILTLTTTGSGAATLIGSTLNIPTPTQGSPFTLQGTTTDAGTDKTSIIDRTGSIEVKNGYFKAIGNGNVFMVDPTDPFGPRLKLGPTAIPSGYFEIGAYNSINNFDTKTRDFNLFSTAKANALYLKNDTGNIGIGTNTPLQKLQVNGNILANGDIMTDATARKYIRATGFISNQIGNIGDFAIADVGFLVEAASLSMIQNQARRLTLANNGNIGIGNSSPSAKLEISSGTSGTSGLKFTDLTSAATPTSSSNYLSLDASGNVIYATSGATLPLINANGTNSATTEVRDYNVWANRGNGFYLTDNLGAISNPIPNSAAWFTLSQVAKGSSYFGQTALNDQGFWFRGGATTTIASNTWLRTLSLNANSKFAVQWDNTTNNTINFNNIDNGPLLFSTNNTERIRILANGNVGVGIVNPNSKFEVVNASLYNGTESDSHGIQVSSGKTNTDYTLYMGADKTNGNSYLQSIKWSVGMAPLILNGRGGNVGIGTPSPSNKLHVLGDARFQFNTNNLGSGGDSVWAEFYGKLPTGTDTQVGGLKLGWYNTFGGIEVLRPSAASGLGLAFNYATTSGVTTEGVRLTNSGNVGIGTINPTSKLEINGAATNSSAFNAAAGTSIDFSKSNLAYTTANAGAFTLTNIKDGGTYTLAVQGATSGTSTFSATGFTFKSPNNGATIASKHTLYTFIVMGTTVYFYMTTGL